MRIAALWMVLGSAAVAAPRSVTIINGTGAAFGTVAARPAESGQWTTLIPGLSPGARSVVTIDPDQCAYDVRAAAGGATLIWHWVNLCETRSVTLNRCGDGALWVDYD